MIELRLTAGDVSRLMLVGDWEEAWSAFGRVVFLRARARRKMDAICDAIRVAEPFFCHFGGPMVAALRDTLKRYQEEERER